MSDEPPVTGPGVPGPSSSQTGVEIGTQIMGTFEIEEHIATGGMGEVYRGRNIHTEEPVAIKIVLAALAHDEKILSLFQKEATVLGRLHHDAIVRYQLFTIDPNIRRACLVMEYVGGRSLADYIEDGPVPLADIRSLVERLAPGLQKAHELGVVHRDLSPDNVIVSDGQIGHAKLIDFGIAKSENFGGGTLLGGQFAGKYNYVSPEQLGRFKGVITEKSDIYSFALVLAAAALGRPLDMGDSPADAVERRMGVPPLDGIDPSLQPLLATMLQPDPAHRPETMLDVLDLMQHPERLPPVSLNTGGVGPGDTQTPVPPQDGARPASGFNFTGPPKAASGDGAAATILSQPPIDRTVLSQPPSSATVVSQPPGGGVRQPGGFSGDDSSESPFGSAGAAPPSAASSLPRVEPVARPAPAAEAPARRGVTVPLVAGLLILGAAAGGYVAHQLDMMRLPFLVEQSASGAAPDPSTSEPSTQETSQSAAAPTTPPADAVSGVSDPATDTSAPDVTDAAPVQPDPVDPPADTAGTSGSGGGEPPTPADPPVEAVVDGTDAPPAVDPTTPVQDNEPTSPTDGGGTELAVLIPPDEPTPPQGGDGDVLGEVGARVDWFEAFPLPPCTHVRLRAVTPVSFGIEAFGPEVAPVQRMHDDFVATFGFEPDVWMRPATEAQCAALDFVEAHAGGTVPAPLVALDTDVLLPGDGTPLRGVLEQVEGRELLLLLVDDRGGAYDISSLIRPGEDGLPVFTLAVQPLEERAGRKPHLIVAVATNDPVPGMAVQPGEAVGTVLDRLTPSLGADAAASLALFNLDLGG